MQIDRAAAPRRCLCAQVIEEARKRLTARSRSGKRAAWLAAHRELERRFSPDKAGRERERLRGEAPWARAARKERCGAALAVSVRHAARGSGSRHNGCDSLGRSGDGRSSRVGGKDALTDGCTADLTFAAAAARASVPSTAGAAAATALPGAAALPNRATNYRYQLQLVPSSSSNWQLVRGLSKQLTSYHYFTGLNS